MRACAVALVIHCDAQGDMTVYVVTEAFFARVRQAENREGQRAGFWTDDGQPSPGILHVLHHQNGVPEVHNLGPYRITGILVDEFC